MQRLSSSSFVPARPGSLLAIVLARSASPGADPASAPIPVARRAAGGPPRSSPPLTPGNRAARRGSDLLLFRPDISPVGTDRASVMRCRRSLALAVGCCCSCHRCCQLSQVGAFGCGRGEPGQPQRRQPIESGSALDTPYLEYKCRRRVKRQPHVEECSSKVQQPHRPILTKADRQRLLTCTSDRQRSQCD